MRAAAGAKPKVPQPGVRAPRRPHFFIQQAHRNIH
jgi:hypothetical protein